MKFAEHLLAHITPEWRKQYISYEVMKTTKKIIEIEVDAMIIIVFIFFYRK